MHTLHKPVWDKVVKLGQLYMPSTAILELTYKCNALCPHCYVNKTDIDDNMDLKAINTTIDKLYDAGILFLTFTGGEIFILPYITDVLEHAFSKKFFGISLNTNGLLLNKRHLEVLIRNRDKLRHINMTVFSHIPEEHDAIMGIPGALETILANASFLQDNNVKTCLKLIVLEKTVHNFTESYRKLTERKFTVRHYCGLCPFPSEDGSYKDEHNSIGTFREYLIGTESLKEDKRRLEFRKDSINLSDSPLCNGLLTMICIDHSGNIKPCVAFRNLNLGNILDPRPLREILRNSKDYAQIRSFSRKDIEKCKGCPHLSNCKFCPGEMHTINPAMNSPSSRVCLMTQAIAEYEESGIL